MNWCKSSFSCCHSSPRKLSGVSLSLLKPALTQSCLEAHVSSPIFFPCSLSKPCTPATLLYSLHNTGVQILTVSHTFAGTFRKPGIPSRPLCLAKPYPLGNKLVDWWMVFYQVQNEDRIPHFLWPMKLRHSKKNFKNIHLPTALLSLLWLQFIFSMSPP